MPFRKIAAERLSLAVIRQIELLILRGILRPGERLPAERELAEKLGVSRPSLRAAIADLQESGLLAARAGAGIFVADVLGSAFSPALIALFAAHDEAVFDMLAFRRDMEGLAAERAARLGSDTDLSVINAIFERMQGGTGVKAGAKTGAKAGEETGTGADLDADFHMAIIEASNNVVMLHMMRSMYDLLRDGVFYNRQMMFSQNISKAALLAQHRAVNDAIQARDPVQARKAVEAHLDYVLAAFRDHRQSGRNEEVARQRLAQGAARKG